MQDLKDKFDNFIQIHREIENANNKIENLQTKIRESQDQDFEGHKDHEEREPYHVGVRVAAQHLAQLQLKFGEVKQELLQLLQAV
jgi:hypothetical protein